MATAEQPGWELEYKSNDMPSMFRLPRRFESFDEAWDTARKIIELYKMDEQAPVELKFYRVK